MSLPLLATLGGDTEIAVLFAEEAEIGAMVMVEAALAEAEAEAGLVEPAAAAAITQACSNFQADHAALAAGLRRDGVAVPELVRQLRAVVAEPHRAMVHWGATSQDIIDTALMLRLKAALTLLDQRLDILVDALTTLSRDEGSTPVMAHTRMQAALPFQVSDKIDTWAVPLANHRARLASIRQSSLAVQLGGPIGTGGSFAGKAALVSASLARRLGLVDAPPWHGDRTRILDIGQALSLLTGTLGKLGQDIALMAQSEVAAIRLAGGGGSSVMAHKQNPVGAELLVALGRFNAGLVGTLHQAMIHENERSGAAWTLEWLVLPQIVQAAGASLLIATRLLDGATFVPLGENPPQG